MKMLKRVFAAVLAVVIGITASVNAFAASAKKTYISDIVAITADTPNKAEALLIKAGYKMVKNSNVNSTLKSGVYIGYKETDNPDEAVTDIAAMNMLGKFSYSDYKQITENNRERIAETIDSFLPVIAEFQVNYDAEKPAAIAAYEAMNAFKDDDSGKLMGDYLLEFDFSNEAEKKMTDTFMQANTQIILAIMQQASFAGDDGDENMIDRLTELGPDGVSKKYKGLYPSVAKANQAMAAEYGSTATRIYQDWNNFYQYILDTEAELIKEENGEISFNSDVYEEKELKLDEEPGDESAKILEGMDAELSVAEATSDFSDFSLYNLLSVTEYGSGTLLDFFKRPYGEVKKEELYPLVEAMSEGQRSQIEMNGLKITLEAAFCDIEEQTEETENAVETVEEVVEKLGVTSIFEGVDRSVFEEGVAFTSAAAEHERLTGESWIEKLTGEYDEKAFWLKSLIVSSVVTGVLAATCITSVCLVKHVEKLRSRWSYYDDQINDINDFISGEITYFHEFSQDKAFLDINGIKVKTPEFQEMENKILEREQRAWNAYSPWYDANVKRIASVIKCVSFVLLAVALVADAVSLYEYFTAPEVTEEKIPHHLMTTATTEYGEDYVYYQTVKNLKGEAQDTNNHEADAKTGWLVLYTTKDKAAGDPILADNLKIQTGSADFKEGTSFVHLFNEKGALNLTAELYTGVKDSANGTYLVFDRDTSTLIGSAVTNGTAAIIGVGGLAIGAVLGAVIAKLAGKKKKKEATAEA